MENSVEAYIEKHPKWSKMLHKLRKIIQSTELEETLKWGMPTYTINNKNVIGLIALKNYVGLWFHQGVFLSDPEQVLQNAQEGKTKGMRHWKMDDIKDIQPKHVKAYLLEAIENEKQGKRIKPTRKATRSFEIPDLLKFALEEDSKLVAMFDTLTPAKKKEYAEYISSAKREATRISRLEKILPLIKEGKPLSALW